MKDPKNNGDLTNENFPWQESSLVSFARIHSGRFKQLSDREVQILGLLAHDMDLDVAAKLLNISKDEAEESYKTICFKLSTREQADFIKYALAFGLMKF